MQNGAILRGSPSLRCPGFFTPVGFAGDELHEPMDKLTSQGDELQNQEMQCESTLLS
jgi:hypothetical protein